MKLHILAVLCAALTHQAKAQDVHPYIKFESGFTKLLDGVGHGKFTNEERRKLINEVWQGSGKNYETSCFCACVGALESNYYLPPPKSQEWIRYEKIRGFFGCHNSTLIAEVKRKKVGGSIRMWLAYFKRDPFVASRFSAYRFSFIVGVYGIEKGLRQWVCGESWKKNPKDLKRSSKYVRDCFWLKRKFFGQ